MYPKSTSSVIPEVLLGLRLLDAGASLTHLLDAGASNKLTLNRAQASLALLSLNRLLPWI